jgi:hypothetical protein
MAGISVNFHVQSSEQVAVRYDTARYLSISTGYDAVLVFVLERHLDELARGLRKAVERIEMDLEESRAKRRMEADEMEAADRAKQEETNE